VATDSTTPGSDGLSEIQRKIDAAVKQQLPFVLRMPDPDRSRCLFCLAYEYLNLDMEERAFPLLEQADPDYFAAQLKEDMAKIPNMTEMVMRILQKLVDAGYVKISPA
jgi:hypothetical protein